MSIIHDSVQNVRKLYKSLANFRILAYHHNMNPNWSLKQIRKIYDLSQSELAEAIGVKSRGTVIAIENGERSLTAEELGRLADFLGLEISDLINFDIPNYDKYKEMLVETLRRYQAYAGHPAPKTFFAKLIYLADFAWFYDTLQPMSGMKYRRDQYGPVPDQFFKAVDELVDSSDILIAYHNLTGRPTQALFLSEDATTRPVQFLSQQERDLIDKIAKKWSHANTEQIVDFTHRQLPWQITRPNEFIPYELITQEEPDNVF